MNNIINLDNNFYISLDTINDNLITDINNLNILKIKKEKMLTIRYKL